MNTTTKSLVSLCTVGIFALLGAGTSGSDNGAPGTSSSSSESPPATTPAKLTYTDASCRELSEKFGPSSKLSDLQKEELWKKYQGKAFKWNLEVTEVSSDTFGGYTVQFKCAPKSPSMIQDIQVKYDDSAKGVVMGMNKGETYEVNGVLAMSSTLLGMTADAIVE